MTIDLNTIDWEYSDVPSESPYCSLAKAFIPCNDGDTKGWELCVTIKTATGGVELTVTPVDKGQNRRAYSSRKMQDWFMLNELFGSEDNWMQFCNAYVGKVIKKYREESNC